MDKEYWDHYYHQHHESSQGPSDFARFVARQYDRDTHGRIIDIGCGNGRDTTFFSRNAIPCTGLDQCDAAAMTHEHGIAQGGLNGTFVQGDFTSCNFDDISPQPYSIYSRFTLHAINYDEEASLFRHLRSARFLKFLFIEARSLRDSLYGQGTSVGQHEFVTTHYRRFVDPVRLKEQLLECFDISYFNEGHGFAKTPTEDPCIIRVIAQRRPQTAR